MAAPKYAIFFPEGDGYLYCRFLGAGRGGSACVVRSISDNKDYVRKKTKPTYGNAPHMFDGVHNPEVEYWRDHPQIPRLVHSQDYRPLPTNHPKYEEFMSSSMFFSYCNGGTLTRFLTILERERIRCPEVLLLHLVDQLLGVVISIHRGANGAVPVMHQSVHACNVFLHYPTEESNLPDIFLGDFDGARKIDESVWDASGNSSARIMRDMKDIKKDDLENKILAEFGGTDDELPPHDTEEQAKSMIDDFYGVSRLIWRAYTGPGEENRDGNYDCTPTSAKVQEALSAFFRETDGRESENYNAVVKLRQNFQQYAEECRQQTNPMPDFQWTRAERYNDGLPTGQPPLADFAWTRYNTHLDADPEALALLNGPLEGGSGYHDGQPQTHLFDTRHELISSSLEVPGPWKIARICPASLRVLAVERLEFAVGVPGYFEVEDDEFVAHADVDVREHQALERQTVVAEVDLVGIPTIVATIRELESSPETPDAMRLCELDGKWNGEALAHQVRLGALAGVVVSEPTTPTRPTASTGPKTPSPGTIEEIERLLMQSPTPPPERDVGGANPNPPQSPAASTGDAPEEHTSTTPPGSPAPPPPQAPNRVAKGRKGSRKGRKGGPRAATAQNPPASTTTVHPATRPRARPARTGPSVQTRSMAATTKRVTRSMTKAAAGKAKK